MRYYNALRRLFYKIVNFYIIKSNKVCFDKYDIYGTIHIINKGTIKLGNNFSANSGKYKNPIGGDNILSIITHTSNASIVIGENVGISNSTIVCWEKVEIGNNVVIGGGCKIWDTNFHSLNPVIRVSGADNDIKTAPIKICDNVFVGGSVIILKGVTIGKNSIIAAGSVVNKDIPESVVAGGNPCRVIKHLDS